VFVVKGNYSITGRAVELDCHKANLSGTLSIFDCRMPIVNRKSKIENRKYQPPNPAGGHR
jgi:hypothetical protein